MMGGSLITSQSLLAVSNILCMANKLIPEQSHNILLFYKLYTYYHELHSSAQTFGVEVCDSSLYNKKSKSHVSENMPSWKNWSFQGFTNALKQTFEGRVFTFLPDEVQFLQTMLGFEHSEDSTGPLNPVPLEYEPESDSDFFFFFRSSLLCQRDSPQVTHQGYQ